MPPPTTATVLARAICACSAWISALISASLCTLVVFQNPLLTPEEINSTSYLWCGAAARPWRPKEMRRAREEGVNMWWMHRFDQVGMYMRVLGVEGNNNTCKIQQTYRSVRECAPVSLGGNVTVTNCCCRSTAVTCA